MVPRAIRHLSVACPGAPVSLHVPSPDTIWSTASTGQCDIGLVWPRSGYAGVAYEAFLTVCGLHAATTARLGPQADDHSVRSRDIALIAGGPGVFWQAIEETFARAGVEPSFAFMAQYTAARCGLVAEGLGLAIIDPMPAREHSGLPVVLRPSQPRLPIEPMLSRPGGRPPSNLAARFKAKLIHEKSIFSIKMNRM
jgi:hypothetical protein